MADGRKDDQRNDPDEQVRRRAYALWEAEGRPEGRDRDHWEQARRELGVTPGPGPEPERELAERGTVADVPVKPAPRRRSGPRGG